VFSTLLRLPATPPAAPSEQQDSCGFAGGPGAV